MFFFVILTISHHEVLGISYATTAVSRTRLSGDTAGTTTADNHQYDGHQRCHCCYHNSNNNTNGTPITIRRPLCIVSSTNLDDESIFTLLQNVVGGRGWNGRGGGKSLIFPVLRDEFVHGF